MFAALSGSAAVSVPLVFGVPGEAVPASTTTPPRSPPMTAASLVPSIRMVIVCVVLSTVSTVKVSASDWPTLSVSTIGSSFVSW